MTTEVDYFQRNMRQCQIEISRNFFRGLTEREKKKKDSCFATRAEPDLKKETKA